MAAAAALHANQIPVAESRLRRHLKQAPTDVAAIRMLAEVAGAPGPLRRRRNAAGALPGARAGLRSRAPQLRHGAAPRATSRPKRWSRSKRLLRVDPRNPGYRNLQGGRPLPHRRIRRGHRALRRAAREYPRSAKIWMSYGHALKTAGRQDRRHRRLSAQHRARAGLRRGVLEPGQPQDVPLRRRPTSQRCARSSRAPDLSAERPASFRFRAGQGAGGRGRLRRLVRALRERQRAAPRQMPLRRRREPPRACARSKRAVHAGFLRASAPAAAAQAPDPIFIVGLPRAGSTLIEQILSSHSAVEGTMELPEIIVASTRELRAPRADAGSRAVPRRAGRARRRRSCARSASTTSQRTRIHRKTGAPFFIDKMPNNFAHVGLIHLMLPNAKIIDARRHPLACCFSGFKQHFARGQNFTYGLDDIGRYYRDYVELMAHFDAVLPGRVHRVSTSTWSRTPKREVRRLLDYCGLPFEDGVPALLRERARRCAPPAPNRCASRSISEGVDHWRHLRALARPAQGRRSGRCFGRIPRCRSAGFVAMTLRDTLSQYHRTGRRSMTVQAEQIAATKHRSGACHWRAAIRMAMLRTGVRASDRGSGRRVVQARQAERAGGDARRR